MVCGAGEALLVRVGAPLNAEPAPGAAPEGGVLLTCSVEFVQLPVVAWSSCIIR